jgi:hypothetical protein
MVHFLGWIRIFVLFRVSRQTRMGDAVNRLESGFGFYSAFLLADVINVMTRVENQEQVKNILVL